MRLALVRHGSRKIGAMNGDDGLSSVGEQQANQVAIHLKSLYQNLAVAIFTSPKRRCVETSRPIVQLLGHSAAVTPKLDECLGHEGLDVFERRVESFVLEYRLGILGNEVIVVSHSDWLECVGQLLLPQGPGLRWGYAQCHLLEISPTDAKYLKTV